MFQNQIDFAVSDYVRAQEIDPAFAAHKWATAEAEARYFGLPAYAQAEVLTRIAALA